MANIVEKQYTFQASTAPSHFSQTGGMRLGTAGLTSGPLTLYLSNSGTATFNSTGKTYLYPTNNAHPIKMDYNFILSNMTGKTSYFIFSIDNIEIANYSITTDNN
jgi:hypothetical protein